MPNDQPLAWDNPVNGWHLFHSFMHGYGVTKGHGSAAGIHACELPDRLTLDEFVRLKQWRQDAIMADLRRKKEERQRAAREYLAANPDAHRFKDYVMPVIKDAKAMVPISDLVSVQAMTRKPSFALPFIVSREELKQ